MASAGGQRPQESPPGEIPDVGSVLLPGTRTALGHAYGGGSQFFSMWVCQARRARLGHIG